MKNAQRRNGKRWMGSLALATAVLGGFVLLVGASGMKAADGHEQSRARSRQYGERRIDGQERFAYRDRESRNWRYENREDRRGNENFRSEVRERHSRYDRDRDRDRDGGR